MELVEAQTPELETPSPVEVPPATEETGSLADHEKDFGDPSKRPPDPEPDDAADLERNAKGRFVKAPHRAESHKAGAKDVEAIQAQTARLRKAETEAGITAPERQQGESDRAYNLRRQADIAEALRDARKAPQNGSGTRQDAPRQPISAPVARRAVPFGEPVPKPEDFGQSENPAEDYYRAIAGHEFRRQIHDAQQVIVAQQAEQSQREQQQRHAELSAKHTTRVQTFAANTPDFWDKLESVEDIKIPDLLAHTIFTDDKSAELMYHLAAHPDELLDLSLIAAPLEIDDQSVSLLRRRLHSQILGASRKGSTGAPASASPVIVAPRPPTPVRTGPLKTGDEPPDDDDSSILNHEKYFGKKRRR